MYTFSRREVGIEEALSVEEAMRPLGGEGMAPQTCIIAPSVSVYRHNRRMKFHRTPKIGPTRLFFRNFTFHLELAWDENFRLLSSLMGRFLE